MPAEHHVWCKILARATMWCASAVFFSSSARAYTANTVNFEFLHAGRYRVTMSYTIPEILEFRESYVEFTSYKEAKRFYFDLLRGADFYPSDPKKLRFGKTPPAPEAW